MKRENFKRALHWAGIRVIRWMFGVKLKDRLSCIELRQQLEMEDIVEVMQRNRMQWYGHVLREDDDDWLKQMCYCGG